MFTFPVTVEDINTVPEEFRSLYEVKDGETSAMLIEALRKAMQVGTGAAKALETMRKSLTAAENAAKAWKAKAKDLFDVDTPEALAERHAEIETEHTTALEAARASSGKGNEAADELHKKQLEQALAGKDREW